MTWEYQMLMIVMHGNSIFCIQLEKNKKTKKTWKNAWQKWYCGVLLMSTFERALWRDIEVVITRRSWKPFVRKGAWVRIPLSPLAKSLKNFEKSTWQTNEKCDIMHKVLRWKRRELNKDTRVWRKSFLWNGESRAIWRSTQAGRRGSPGKGVGR